MTRRDAARRPRATQRLSRADLDALHARRERAGGWHHLVKRWPELSVRTLARAASGVRVTRLVAFVIRARLQNV